MVSVIFLRCYTLSEGGGQSRVPTSFWAGVKIIFFYVRVRKLFYGLMVGEREGRKIQLFRYFYIKI
jgi:hypothetical protein